MSLLPLLLLFGVFSLCAFGGPVLEVSLQQEDEQLLCRSEGLFPKPSVSWTPSSAALTTFKSSERGVWSVLSSVSLTHKPPHEYSCNVSTPHSWRSATYRRNWVYYHLDVSDSVEIPCSEPMAPVKSLIWRFNHRETILNWSGPELVYTESWRRFVEGVTESNSLVLKDLTQDQMGLFSCELSTEQETHVTVTEVTEVRLFICEMGTETQRLWVSIAASVSGVLILILVIIVVVKWRRRKNVPPREEGPKQEMPDPDQAPESTELSSLRKYDSEASVADSIAWESLKAASRPESSLWDGSSGYGQSYGEESPINCSLSDIS